VEGWDDGELKLAGVRAAMAFRGVEVEKEDKNATNSSAG
jgi:hypothetical protein